MKNKDTFICNLQDIREKFLGEQTICRVENYGLLGSKMLNVISKILKIPTGQDSVIFVNCSCFRTVRFKLAEQFKY